MMSASGQKAKYSLRADVFRFTPESGLKSDIAPCPFRADIVAKVLWRTKILRAADAFYARRREGPYCFIQHRSRTSVLVLKSDAAAEKSKDHLSRDFQRHSIFYFCNNICQEASELHAPTEPSAARQPVWQAQKSSRRSPT
jgi:hypothetical protein